MPNILKAFIIICILIFFIYVIKNVKNNKLNIQNALIWIGLSIGIIISVIFVDSLDEIAELIGVKTVSNLLFFIGFIFMIFVCFNTTKIISTQNKKIITLTQELALLRKGNKDDKNK